MSQGHGIMINMNSYLPFVFEFNPVEIETRKKINYVVAPNIGGSHKKRYFTGFDSGEVDFKLQCIDKESPLGVKPQVGYFEQMRNPDPGLIGVAASFFGNENYPPPQILFQFGVSMVPLVWDVLDVQIKTENFYSGHVSGIMGIPKVANVSIKMALVEDHILNKANKIAEKAMYVAGSVESLVREGKHKWTSGRKESLYPPTLSLSGW